MKDFDLRVINLGAGVQSSTMYLMAALGELTPIPDVAIFADTQNEPPWVYQHVSFLMSHFHHRIPIQIVTAGNLKENLYYGYGPTNRFAQIPAFLDGNNGDRGKRGKGRRGCTRDFKIIPIEREIKRILGIEKGQRVYGKYQVEQWLGISTDEAHRAKPSDRKWITRRWRLLFDVPMRRGDCVEWCKKKDFPIPKKSSCYFCPNHNDFHWRELRDHAPDLFADAGQIDEDLRNGSMKCSKGLRKPQFLHGSLRPLREIDFDLDEEQRDFFSEECEGVCGV